jgi:hypothetical protein
MGHRVGGTDWPKLGSWSPMRAVDFLKQWRASKLPGGVGADAQNDVLAKAAVPKTRRRLFTKYVALFVAVVCIALVSNGVFDVLFYYRENKASLVRIQREQAEAAAAKIGQFVKEIESQLGWTTQLPWSAGSLDQRRFDALRLLRQGLSQVYVRQCSGRRQNGARGSRSEASRASCGGRRPCPFKRHRHGGGGRLRSHRGIGC